MVVMKFGGASLRDCESLNHIAGIIQENSFSRRAVVLSAVGGVTDCLLESIEKAMEDETTIPASLDKIESIFSIELALRGDKIMFDGEPSNTKNFKKYMKHMLQLSQENGEWHEDDFFMSLSMIKEGKIDLIKEELNNKVKISISNNGKVVYPKTFNQRQYVKSLQKNDLVFAIGPAGTGKTFLAISMALNFLFSKQEHIVRIFTSIRILRS